MDDSRTPPFNVARLKRLGVYATVVFAAFLLGFIPMWMVAQRHAHERDAAQRDQLITLLARADPAAADRLAEAYVSYRHTAGTLPQPSR